MVTTSIKPGATWTQVTDGTQDYAISVLDTAGDNGVRVTLTDTVTAPAEDAPFFVLKNGEGISQLTHAGFVWVKLFAGSPVLIVNK